VETRKQIVAEIVRAGALAADVPTIEKPFRSRITGFQGELVSYLLTAHLETAAYKQLLDAMDARADRQTGASSGASGTTSLATKGAVAQILAAAVEQGAFEKDVTGTTVTFRAKPAGVIRFLQNKGLLDIYRDYGAGGGARLASRFSLAASFDTSRGSRAGALTADRSQFSGWSVRGEVVNHRDAALSRYATRWRELLDESGPFATAAESLHEALREWDDYERWRASLEDEIDAKVEAPFRASGDRNAAAARFKTVLEARLAELHGLGPLPDRVQAALDGFVRELVALEKGIGDIHAFANTGALLTLEIASTRDPQLPDLYTATAILEAALGAARKTDLVVNGEASYYGSLPEGATRRLKNVAFSAELNHPLGSVLGLRSTRLALALRYSYLPHDTMGAGAAAAPRGGIGVVQARLTVPVKGSAVKVPLSVTFANRTEAIKEKIVRANFGVTLDLDALIAASKAGR
jgi:hypothetical protein